ncbi:Heat shock 70 kDa 12B-like protein [Cladobotryum mycophilum]|uniref:Heat shock 70 kDa 12B-like protein n=1 Tax=Cladobotryum mycophilum TaxID=491253 RepID=A0ABR0SEZ4_9HYPO
MPIPTRTRGSRASGRTRRRDNDSAIIVGIDFGTTYSGVAWSLSSQPDQINIITNWDSILLNNSDKEKSPTAISYEDGNETPTWGYNVPSHVIAARWFKLCLLDDEDIPANIRESNQLKEARALLTRLNKHAIEVISNYLRELWDHSIENIERSVGRGLVQLSRFKIVVTLPAIWPAYAQARMKQAIEQAGILEMRSAGDTTLTFVSEPEAAALATIEDMCGRADIKPKDHFIVCDAGGGTVDIITYTVVKTQPLTVRESIKGEGKLCGAVFLDDGFKTLLRKVIPRSI